MPLGEDPPDPGLPQSVFNALTAMDYDSGAMAFDDSGVNNYMFVQKKSGI